MRSDLVYRGKIGVRRLIPSFPKRAEKRREWTKSAYKGATGSELKLAHGRASDAIDSGSAGITADFRYAADWKCKHRLPEPAQLRNGKDEWQRHCRAQSDQLRGEVPRCPTVKFTM